MSRKHNDLNVCPAYVAPPQNGIARCCQGQKNYDFDCRAFSVTQDRFICAGSMSNRPAVCGCYSVLKLRVFVLLCAAARPMMEFPTLLEESE
jgi:hypothetical protein